MKVQDLRWPRPVHSRLNSTDSLLQEQVGIFEAFRTKTEYSKEYFLEFQDVNTIKKHLDSLRAIKSPDTIVSKYLVSMQARSDSLQQLLRLPPQTAEAARLQQRTQEELNRMPAQINEKLKLFSDQGANVGQVSGFSLPGFSTDLPSQAMQSTSLPDVQNASGAIPGINGPAIPAVPNINTDLPKSVEVAEHLGEVSKAGRQIVEVVKDLKTVTSGNLDSLDTKTVESRLAEVADLPGFSVDLTDAAKQAELLKKWNSDPLYQREMAVTLAKEQAVNHFAGREAQVLAAMEQLDKAKSRVKDVEQVVDLFARPANPMKGKPFIERLRPGINLHLQWNQIVLLDINPYVGYRLSGHFTTGVGWNERVGFSSDSYSFSSRDRLYGPRAFVHFKFKEANFLILSPELMHAVVPGHTVQTGESTSKWVPGLMGGYRREFRYSKKVIGTVQFLYNIVAPTGQSPYASRFNVLFGFEFPLKKKPKSV